MTADGRVYPPSELKSSHRNAGARLTLTIQMALWQNQLLEPLRRGR